MFVADKFVFPFFHQGGTHETLGSALNGMDVSKFKLEDIDSSF